MIIFHYEDENEDDAEVQEKESHDLVSVALKDGAGKYMIAVAGALHDCCNRVVPSDRYLNKRVHRVVNVHTVRTP